MEKVKVDLHLNYVCDFILACHILLCFFVNHGMLLLFLIINNRN